MSLSAAVDRFHAENEQPKPRVTRKSKRLLMDHEIIMEFYPSVLRPDRRGRERFVDRVHSVHRTLWKIFMSRLRS